MFLHSVFFKFPHKKSLLHQIRSSFITQWMQKKRMKKNRISHNKIKRKENKLSPLSLKSGNVRTFFFASLHGSITVEAAAVIPLFLFCMISALQFGNVMECAVKFGSSLAENSKTIAVAAYATKYGGNIGDVGELAAGALSAAYVQGQVVSQAKDTSSVKNINMIQSSFLNGDEIIDLVLSYQMKSPIQIIRLPQNFYIQRARVRAWTGRTSSGNIGEEEGEEQEIQYAYVTEYGSVFHTSLECTYLRLSIHTTDMDTLPYERNSSGEIYRSCEHCGGRSDNGVVYITSFGNRYHNSLQCSELTRTIQRVPMSEVMDRRACSRCGSQVMHTNHPNAK